MVIVYAAALRRHQQYLEAGCDRHGWHVLARHLIERAVWSANIRPGPCGRQVILTSHRDAWLSVPTPGSARFVTSRPVGPRRKDGRCRTGRFGMCSRR